MYWCRGTSAQPSCFTCEEAVQRALNLGRLSPLLARYYPVRRIVQLNYESIRADYADLALVPDHASAYSASAAAGQAAETVGGIGGVGGSASAAAGQAAEGVRGSGGVGGSGAPHVLFANGTVEGPVLDAALRLIPCKLNHSAPPSHSDTAGYLRNMAAAVHQLDGLGGVLCADAVIQVMGMLQAYSVGKRAALR